MEEVRSPFHCLSLSVGIFRRPISVPVSEQIEEVPDRTERISRTEGRVSGTDDTPLSVLVEHADPEHEASLSGLVSHVFLAVMAILGTVAFLACALPAVRAVRYSRQFRPLFQSVEICLVGESTVPLPSGRFD